MYKKITIVGNLTSDATVKEVTTGRSVINFTVAVNTYFKNKGGEKNEHVSFFDCGYWRDNQYTKIANYLKKGGQVLVEGEPLESCYKKGEETIPQIKITVSEVKLLSKVNKDETTG